MSSKKRRTILIVEDDASIRDGLLIAIEDHGMFDAVPVENGIAALDYLSKNPMPDAIVTDYAMLGDGAGVAAVARRLKIPIVMITGLPEDAKKALSGIFIDIPIFNKPFDVWDLLIVVDKLTKDRTTNAA